MPNFIEADLGDNPLANYLVVPVNEVFKGKIKVQGEEVDNNILYDATPHTKLFIGRPNKESVLPRQLINALSDKAQRLFLWLIYELDPGKDYLWINQTRYMEEQGIKSINTYKDAVKELVKFKIIGLSVVKSVYWINPVIFFRGSRIDKYPDKIYKR